MAKSKHEDGLCERHGVTWGRSNGHFARIVCNVEHEHQMHWGELEGFAYGWYDREPVSDFEQ